MAHNTKAANSKQCISAVKFKAVNTLIQLYSQL